MKRILLLSLGALLIASSSFAQDFWCVQKNREHLLTVDISNGTITDSIGVSAANIATNPIAGFQGMAQHPSTGDVYVLFKDDIATRYLGTMDMVTGIITTIAATTSDLATIAFDPTGVLYAMEGAGSTQMYTLNIATGAETAFHNYASSSSDGEALAFNTTDNLMYRYGGGSDGDWVSLNLGTLAEVTISTMSGLDTWGGALAYRSGQNKFVLGLGETFYDVLPNGTTTTLGDVTASNFGTADFKGMVKATTTPPCAVNVAVTDDGSTITATATGLAYRWLDCNNAMAVIAGETADNYTPAATGDYAVEITDGPCVDTSACTNIVVTGLNKLTTTGASIYPNPTNKNVTVDLGNLTGTTNYSLFTIDGRLVGTKNTTNNSIFTVDLTNEANGVYFLKINNNTSVKTYKVIKR